MLNTKLFEYSKIYCANDYVMAREERSWKETSDYISANNLRVDNLVFKPKTNQIRFMLLPCRANRQTTEVFNVTNPPTEFLRMFWELGLMELQNAMTQYMLQSDLKQEYQTLEESEKRWVSAIILGSKESENDQDNS